MLRVTSHDTGPIRVGAESVRVQFDTGGVARATVGSDSLAFDLRRLVRTMAVDSTLVLHDVPADRLRLYAATPTRRAVLALEYVNGSGTGETLVIQGWQGTLFVGKAK
jgi:hypothetical protein